MLDSVEVSAMACFFISCQCQPTHPSLIHEGQSRVYQSRRILANSISLLVMTCDAKCGHPMRRSCDFVFKTIMTSIM